MKLFFLAVLLSFTAAVYASDSTALFQKADELTAQKKYNSAFKLLSDSDGKGTKSDVVVKEASIAMKYFAQSIMHQAFGFADLEPGQTIEDVRGKPGSYSLYQLPLDKILGELIANLKTQTTWQSTTSLTLGEMKTADEAHRELLLQRLTTIENQVQALERELQGLRLQLAGNGK